MTRPSPSSPAPRRAPRPQGPLSGRRRSWRRLAAIGFATVNRTLDRLPPGRWLHRRVLRGLEMPEIDVPLARGAAGLDGLRIAFLSDLHAGSFMGEADLVRLFESVAATAPDLVCLGGDLVNTSDREILLFREPLRRLSPPLGIFAVPGNHDHFYGREIGLWCSFLADHGVEVLLDRGRRIRHRDGSLWVCGVDDFTESTPDLAAALRGRDPDEPALLLSHHPDLFYEAAPAGVDLTLSGHTHGGQIVLFGWSPLRHSAFGWQRGLFADGDARLYVGRGVGVTLLPLRVGAPPEVPLLRLRAGVHVRPAPAAAAEALRVQPAPR